MLGEWDVNPLPAYDMHGHLIEPNFYQRRLEGALVEVHFTLTHWSIGKKGTAGGTDIYTGDIEYIRVLAPPKPTLVTPRRRKIFAVDPIAPSTPITPTKKCRTE